ncbi:sporulation protein YhbH [Paraliobacillus ryukyuensis]|uniref:sporulation protein YhbH n=1 Tax=Paraliobacillus ryukyuensis TaxID=200904 RepID=UPI0009A74742|nr:sporulation protein YhbH [Paraliobacillus ryukyuensis]
MHENNFIISEEDWSIHRKGYDDQKRHQDKIQEVLKQKLPDLISEENIIMSRGKDVIRIPIRSLDEYKIRYSQEKNKHAGQGNGKTRVGDTVAKGRPTQQQPGKGDGAGDQPGQDYYEAEVTLEELEETLFQQLALPNLQEKEKDNLITTDIHFNDIRKQGLAGNIDKKRTLLQAYRRNAMQGEASFHPVYPDDLRYKTWNEIKKPDSAAVILAMMDTSGSMGQFEKYAARSFFFWLTRFLKTNYETVKIEFIAHHTEAKIVDEESFFSKGESGGTLCSSAYRKALKLIDQKYDSARYNIYPFHVSDGDNLTSDNRRCVNLVKQLLDHASYFGYIEVNPYQRHSTLMQLFKAFNEPNFDSFILRKKADVYHAIQHFFKAEKEAI